MTELSHSDSATEIARRVGRGMIIHMQSEGTSDKGSTISTSEQEELFKIYVS